MPSAIFTFIKLSRRIVKNVHYSIDGKVRVESENILIFHQNFMQEQIPPKTHVM